MNNDNHIGKLLNYKLSLIGSAIILDSDSNEIGEQIAYQNAGERSIQVIRLNNAKEVWISFTYFQISLGSTESAEIEKLAKSIHSFLDLKMSLVNFYDNDIGIKSPVDISVFENEIEVLKELHWFRFLEPAATDLPESKKWVATKGLALKIKPFASALGLIPFRSIDRLCFSMNINTMTENFPFLDVSFGDDDSKEYKTGNYDNTFLYFGTEKEVIVEFKKRTKKLTTTHR